MRNIHKSTPPSFRRRENAAAIVKAPPPGALTKGPDRKFPGLHPPSWWRYFPFALHKQTLRHSLFLRFSRSWPWACCSCCPVELLHAQDGNGPIMYAENGTGPVATYTAVDPEGTGGYLGFVGRTTLATSPLTAACLPLRSRPTTRSRDGRRLGR